MRVAVIGVGAVGGWLLGRLTQAGVEVSGVARGPTLDRLAARSALTVESLEGSWAGPVDVSDRIRGPVDLSIVAVKSPATASAAGMVPPSELVVSAQNGLGNVEVLRSLVGGRITAALVYTACHRVSPTHVRLTSEERLVVADVALARFLTSNGVPADVVDDIDAALWQKAVVNVALNPVSALLDQTLGGLRRSAPARRIVQAAAEEVARVAAAEGADVAGTAETILERLDALPARNVTSMLQDRRTGRPMEVDALTGYVSDRGRKRGVATPAVGVLDGMLRAVEAGHPPQGRINAAAIEGAIAAAVTAIQSSPRTYNG